VYRLDPRKHLLRYHDDRLDGESPAAVIEQVFERGTEEVDDQDVVQALLAKVVDIRNTGCSGRSVTRINGVHRACSLTAADKNLVRSILIPQLGGIALSRFLRQSAATSWSCVRE
jgi:hypothetical protein